MSHFYGTLQGMRGQATRCGSKDSGISTAAASWSGAIKVEVFHDDKTGEERYNVYQSKWHSAGVEQHIADGVIGQENVYLKALGVILKHKETFPALMGLDQDLDKLLAKELQQ